MITAYFGGRVDFVFQRLIDILMSLPGLLMALVIAVALGSSLFTVLPGYRGGDPAVAGRIARGSTLSVRSMPSSRRREPWSGTVAHHGLHILPNILAPIIVIGSVQLGFAIMTEAGLSSWGGVAPGDSVLGQPNERFGAPLHAEGTLVRDLPGRCARIGGNGGQLAGRRDTGRLGSEVTRLPVGEASKHIGGLDVRLTELLAEETPQLNRRRFLAASATLGGAGLVVAACGSGEEEPATTGTTPPGTTEGGATSPAPSPTTQPKKGGEVAIRMAADPPNWSVYTASIYAASFTNRIYNKLLNVKAGPDIDPQGEVTLVADLAEALPEQPEPTRYLFQLKKGPIRFHNKPPVSGRELTPEDVKEAMDAYRTDTNSASGQTTV